MLSDRQCTLREVINHLTALNTARTRGKRGRRVECTIGWPCDERTMTGLGETAPRTLIATGATSNAATLHDSKALVAVPGLRPNDAAGETYLDQKGQVLSMTGTNAASAESTVTP